MTENTTREMRAVSMNSPEGLLVPTENPFNDSRRRSTSLARSFQSHVTVVEEEKGTPDIQNFRRQQTFKSPLKLSRWVWMKGFFNLEALMRRIENTMQIVSVESPPEKVLRESEFIVDILVSPKINSTRHHNVRCLLDTGCLRGNLVTRELVESLGYAESDFQQLTPYEARGAQTLTGEPFSVEGAVFLSWHHGSSLITYRRMRFLVILSSKFEMIIGSDTISKYGLLVPPVFATEAPAARHEPGEGNALDQLEQYDPDLVLDPVVVSMKAELRNLQFNLQDDRKFLKDEKKKPVAKQDVERIERVYKRIPKQEIQEKVQQLRLDAQIAEQEHRLRDAKRLRTTAKQEEDAWNAEHPPAKPAGRAQNGAQNGTQNGTQDGTQNGRPRVNTSGPQSVE